MILLIEILGWVGMLLILLAYYLNSAGKVENNSVLYQWINFFGAVCIIVNCTYKEAWAIVALDTFWALIAVSALWKMRKYDDAFRAPGA